VVHRQLWPCANPSEPKTFVHQKFHGIHLGTFVGPSQPHISKTTNFIFSQTPPKSYGYATMHRPTWPSANSIQYKTFVHQDFYSTHLGTFVGFSNPHISKTTNFIFSQNSPPSHLSSRGAPTNLAKCKLHPIQNFRAPRLLQYSFGDICRRFQPSHLKNHEFHFFRKLPTKPYCYDVVHRLPWPCAKSSELKTFVHQDFHSTHLGTFVGLSDPHISKPTNFIFSQNSPPSHLPISWYTANLGHVQNPPNSKLLCTKTFTVLIWVHL